MTGFQTRLHRSGMTLVEAGRRCGQTVWVVLLVLVMLSGLVLPVSVHADYQTGLDAYQQGDFDMAYYEWIKAAVSKEGEAHPAFRAESQYALGMLYWLGQGVEQDTSAAAVWLREAAELDHAGAQSKLGYLYLSGEGVPHNDFEALKWLQMAAYKNDPDAQYNLGVMYRDGLGVDPNPDQSMYWFKQAADNGDAVSAGIVAEEIFVDPAFQQKEAVPAENSADAGVAIPGSTGTAEGIDDTPVTTASPYSTASQSAVPAATNADAGVADLPRLDQTVAGSEPGQGEMGTAAEAAEFIQDKELGDDWIRQREPEHYTIQVIALQRLDKLHTFIGQHPDWKPFAIYRQQYQGKPLYILIQGDYSNVAQARDAAQRFPPGFQRREELWIRRFMMVQGLLP